MQIKRFDWFIAVLPPGPSDLVHRFEIHATVVQIDFQLLNHF